jgi:hypothetical protein
VTGVQTCALPIFSMPEVDAVVSLGVPYTRMTLPAVEKIIGKRRTLSGTPAIDGEIVRMEGGIKGAGCQLGSFRVKAVRY